MATRKDDNQKTHIESDATPQLDEIGIAYHQPPDIVADARTIIDSAQAAARCAVNVTLVVRNWLLGDALQRSSSATKNELITASR